MTHPMTITARGDQEIVVTRAFDAPKAMVYDAHTKPDLIRRWLLGPDGWTMPICEVDLRVGGKVRYVWERGKDRMELSGTFNEVVKNERIVVTQAFVPTWYEGKERVTSTFVEKGGTTTLTLVIHYDSNVIREGVLKSPMAKGMEAGYARLDGLFEENA